jgi:D-cysteine desulfhydrase
VWVKRDDLTGFALAGNKARKLEYTIADAVDRGCDVLVTGGGAGSNHCRGAAVAAGVAGLDAVIVLAGTEPAEPHPNLAMIRRAGAQLRFTGDPDRASVDPALEAAAAELASNGRRPSVLPRGGATALGAYGYAVAANELAEQLDRAGVEPSLVVVAVGSCGTYAGLLTGAAALGRTWTIAGVSVSRPPEECRERVAALSAATAELQGGPAPPSDAIRIVDGRGPGFGVASDRGRRAADLAAGTEGLVLDPTYTAKAMAAMVEIVERGVEGPVVFVHTGGQVGAIEELRHAEDDGTG